MKLHDFLELSAERFGSNPAVIHGAQSVTYTRLYNSVLKLSNRLLKSNLIAGDRVALWCENSIQYVVSYFAILKAGFVIVPVDTSLHPDKIDFILNDCSVKGLITQSKNSRYFESIIKNNPQLSFIATERDIKITADNIDLFTINDLINNLDSNQFVAVDKTSVSDSDHFAYLKAKSDKTPHELAAIFYTSGSTGKSKGVMLSHLNLISNTIGTVEYLKLTKKDRVMVVLPFYYIYGNSLLLTHISVGGTVVIENRFAYPETALATMEKENVTGFSGVPSTFMILLNSTSFPKRKFPSLRYFTQAGGGMSPEFIKKLADAFPEKEIYIMYGQTEASPRVTWLPPKKLQEKMGSIGIEVPGVHVKIINESGDEASIGEEGEIIVGGNSVMMGYWDQSNGHDKVLKDGWLYTGDLARMDEDGYIFIVGRKKEIIKSGGNRVSAKELEECILKIDGITEVAVFGVEDPVLGEAIHAAVVKNDNSISEKIITDFCTVNLSSHKVPKYITFMASLPKYQTGKINKSALKQELNNSK
ncbi:MAG: class I adenylate-forming enzyme family protein [bacterium]